MYRYTSINQNLILYRVDNVNDYDVAIYLAWIITVIYLIVITREVMLILGKYFSDIDYVTQSYSIHRI
jgi:hypothetical protein